MSGSPIKPSQAARDERGRVNLDELTDADLDYGTDEAGLASLRRRLKRAIYTYEGVCLSQSWNFFTAECGYCTADCIEPRARQGLC